MYVKKMENKGSRATLANFYPNLFSQLPDDMKYTVEIENIGNNSNYDEIEEKINEIDLSIQLSSNKKRNTRSRSSFHSFSTRSSHSSRSSKTQNSELTTSSLFQTTGSLSNMNFNNCNSNASPTPIKITHIIKRKKKKNSNKSRKRSPIKNYMKNVSPKIPKVTANEQKPIFKKKNLPFTILYPGYQIRFNYHPKDVIYSKESLGCPIILTYRNGDIETRFNNGTSQILHCRNKFTYFANGDIQHEFPDGAIAYFYASNKATEFFHPNGTRVIQFISGGRYTYYPNVKIDITYHQFNSKGPPFCSEKKLH